MKMLSIFKKSLFLFSLVPIVSSLYAADSSLTAFRGGGEERGNWGNGERGNWGNGERGGEEKGSHPESSYYSQHPMDKPYNQGEVQGFEKGADYGNNQGQGSVYVVPENNNPYYNQYPYQAPYYNQNPD